MQIHIYTHTCTDTHVYTHAFTHTHTDTCGGQGLADDLLLYW